MNSILFFVLFLFSFSVIYSKGANGQSSQNNESGLQSHSDLQSESDQKSQISQKSENKNSLQSYNKRLSQEQDYESTVYGTKLRKATQLEAKSEGDSSGLSFDNLTDFLSHKTPIFFQYSLVAPPQWTFRGSNAAHTLILIDDNPIYDPSTIQGTWDLNLWPNTWAKSILVETSPFAGTLKWGGHGSGSLIKIESIDKSNLNLNATSNKSVGVSAGKHFEQGHLQLLSENKNIKSPFIDSKEIYPLKNRQGLAKLQIPFAGSDTPFKTLILYGESERNLPDWNQDTKNFMAKENHLTASMTWTPHSDRLEQNFGIQANAFERKYLNNSNTPFDEKYRGNSNFLSYSGDYLIIPKNRIKFGISHLQESIYSVSSGQPNPLKKSESTPTYFGHEFFFNEDLALQWGARAESSGSNSGTNLNPAIELRDRQWSINLFKTQKCPSLYQMYDSFYGNPKLESENIQQVTLETHGDFDQNSYQFFLFSRESKNIIDYDMVYNKYYNIAQSKTQGFEAHLRFPIKKLTWELMGTLQNSIDQQKKLLAPEKLLNSTWSLPLSLHSQTQITGVWNSELKDKNLPSYSIWNWSWQYLSNSDLAKNIFSVAINNLTQTKVTSNKQYLVEDRTINFQFNSEF